MEFTETEKQQWHADRLAGTSADDDDMSSATCGHCGNPFSAGAGVVTADFSLCDVCNGN